MKFKEQRGNVFVFDGGDAGGELEMSKCMDTFTFENIYITKDMYIVCAPFTSARYQDIQTAASLMQILIEEGLV